MKTTKARQVAAYHMMPGTIQGTPPLATNDSRRDPSLCAVEFILNVLYVSSWSFIFPVTWVPGGGRRKGAEGGASKASEKGVALARTRKNQGRTKRQSLRRLLFLDQPYLRTLLLGFDQN